MSEPRIQWTLPAQRARLLRDLLGAVESGRDAVGWRAVAQSLLGELQRAMDSATPRPRVLPAPLAFPKPSALDDNRKRHERRGQTAREHMKVYDAVTKRADGFCECGCGRPLDTGLLSRDVRDHFWGRAKAPTREDTVWVLRNDCNLKKTDNKPNRVTWLSKYLLHCRLHGYHEQAARCVRELEAESAIRRAAEVSRVLR